MHRKFNWPKNLKVMPAFKILKDFCKYRHLGISKKTRSMHFN